MPQPAPPPGRSAPVPAPERVYEALRTRIINLDLPPGTTLSRHQIKDDFGVSQMPVREALQRLEGEGLVQIFPQSRTVVSRIDVRQLSETQFLRVAIESEVVRRLVALGPADVIRRARTVLDMQRTLLGVPDEMPTFMELDRRFHRTLFAGVGMENLHAMLLDRLGHLYRCQRLELPHEGRMQGILDAHDAILDAMADGTPEQAVQAMRDHLSGTISRVEQLRRDYPDHFTDDAFRWAAT